MTADLDAVLRRATRTRHTLERQAGEARVLATTGQRLTTEIADLRHQVDLHEHAAKVLANIGEQRQNDTQTQIEALVTQGLHTIFGPELSFHLIPGIRAKTPVIDFIMRTRRPDGTTMDTDILEANGGGLAAICGFLLRVVVLLLSRERQDTVLILDEPFAHLSADHEPALAAFLRELVDKTGVQVILVTHSHTGAFDEHADTRYRLSLRDGATQATAW